MPDTQDPCDQDLVQRAWHAQPVEEAVRALGTKPEVGLSHADIDRRRQRFGANRLTRQTGRTAFKRVISQFNNLFVYLLLGASLVMALLGEWLDSGVVFGVVLIIVIIGFVQEGRAERALEAVRGMLSRKATVVRQGKRQAIPAEQLVVGDLVLVEAGDQVPADVRLIQTKNLQVQEAALTGESTAVEKTSEPVAEDAELGDRASMAFSGTVVTSGEGTGVAVAVGDATEIGRISGMLSEIETLRTPLMLRLDAFTKAVSAAILALSALVWLVGVFAWGRDWGEMFIAAVSVAVAAIPEGLPAVMTVTLALGVQRMARHNAIVRRLPAVETLGSVTIIFSDKTGTLTKNEMTVNTVRTAEEDIEVTGVGYELTGGFYISEHGIALKDYPAAIELVRAGLLCNDAGLDGSPEQRELQGDPTEVALIVLAYKAGFEPRRENEASPRMDGIPFASERRYMATLNKDEEGTHIIYVKGAPERVLEMCASERRSKGFDDCDVDLWRQRADVIAGRGQRVLAIARKELGGKPDALDKTDAERGLILLGLVGLIDPPREEAIDAIKACQSAGIRVKMVTGDHKLTAQAIARELGLDNPEETLTGRELQDLPDDEMRRKAIQVDVFARASPEHKLRLVKAVQDQHQVTAMTGDGVNDAPALKRADIGVAMGKKGTDAAREAAAMVLADDNFASIERAVEEGRTVYDNVQKAIFYLLPTSVAEASIIVLAVLFGLTLPITPLQILWINMVTAATLGVALAWEKSEGDVMRRPPRPSHEPLLTGFMLWRTGFVGLLLLLGAGFLFLQEQERGQSTTEFARTLSVNVLVIGEIVYLINARYFLRPAYTWEGLFGSRAVLIAIGICLALQLMFIYAPFMNVLFDTEPLDAEAWVWCIGIGLMVFALVELEKAILSTRLRPNSATAARQVNPRQGPDQQDPE